MAQQAELILLACQVVPHVAQVPGVIDRHRGLVDEVVEQQQLERAQPAVFVQGNVQRPKRLIGDHQRQADDDLSAGRALRGVDVEVRFFVRKHRAMLPDGARAEAIGPRHVLGQRGRMGPAATRDCGSSAWCCSSYA